MTAQCPLCLCDSKYDTATYFLWFITHVFHGRNNFGCGEIFRQNFVYIFIYLYYRHIPTQYSRANHPNNVRWKLQVMKLLFMCFPSSPVEPLSLQTNISYSSFNNNSLSTINVFILHTDSKIYWISPLGRVFRSAANSRWDHTLTKADLLVQLCVELPGLYGLEFGKTCHIEMTHQ